MSQPYEYEPDYGWCRDPDTGTWHPDHNCPAEDGEPCWCAEGRHITKETP